MEIRQVEEFKKNSEVCKRLAKIEDPDALTPEERYYYEADLKIARDTINQLRWAYQAGFNKGYSEGIAEMKADGISKIQKEVATNMIREGFDPKLISTCTGLSESKLTKL